MERFWEKIRAMQRLFRTRGARFVCEGCAMRVRRGLLGAAAGIVLGLTGVSLAGAAPSTVYPSSIAVLGHSGATGYDSDPRHPRIDVPANSWATGTNPAVKSLYLRLLALNPAIRGNNVNFAQDGATVDDLMAQATAIVQTLKPPPGLVLIQIMDNDIRCDGSDAKNVPQFGKKLAAALHVIAKGLPDARMFVVSQFGSPATYVRALTPAQRKRIGGGKGPCDFLTRAGTTIPKKLAYLDGVIHSYEGALAAACKATTGCFYDGGAFGNTVDRQTYISEDTNHFTVRGHAKAAAVAWAAMLKTGVIPFG
jgi:hypothetical protein